MQLWDAFWKWANESPLGAAVVGGLIVAAVVGVLAIFPKLRKRALADTSRAARFLASLRLTTTTRQAALVEEAIAARSALPFVRVRWAARMKDAKTIQLINTTGGSVTRNVAVDAFPNDVQLFGQTDFAEIKAMQATNITAFMPSGSAIYGPTLVVTWANEHGVVQTDEIPIMGV